VDGLVEDEMMEEVKEAAQPEERGVWAKLRKKA
jgi:hypothetical protein